MAISTATRTSYGDMLRYVYTPKLWKLQNHDRILLQIFQRDVSQYAEGKSIQIRLHTAGNGGVGYSTSGALPTPGVQQFGEATANYARIYGRFKVDGALIASTRTGYAAEVRALQFEAKQLIEDLTDALAYDIWHDGTGKLGGQLSNPSGGASTTSFRIPIAGCGIRKNQIIDVTTTAGAVTEGKAGVIVEAIAVDGTDSTKYLVTVDGALGGTGDVGGGTYYAYRQGSRAIAISGVDHYVADAPTSGTVLGINRATAGNEYWRNQYKGNGGVNREITFELMQEMIDTIEKNSPGTTKLIVTTHAVWRKIAKLLTADKRYPGEQVKLKGWCNGIQFAGMPPIVRDKYCPDNHMYFFDTDTWTIYQDGEGGFIDEDGQILQRVAGYDQFEAAWRRFLQPVCSDPASNGVIFDLSE